MFLYQSTAEIKTINRVPIGQEKVREILLSFNVREKSENFAKWPGKFKIPRKSGKSQETS